MKTIDLTSLCDSSGVIILIETGVQFTNQVGGVNCANPSAEGVFVPWFFSPELHDAVYNAWPNLSVRGGGLVPLDVAEKTRLKVAQILSGCDLPFRLREDESECGEAWLTVSIVDEGDVGALTDFIGCKAILTWTNSD